MVCRLQLTYDAYLDILDVKYIAGSTIGYTSPPGVYEIRDINLTLKTLLPGKVKVKTTIDDFRPKSNLTNNKTFRFTKKVFSMYYIRFYGITLRSIRCHLGFCSIDFSYI